MKGCEGWQHGHATNNFQPSRQHGSRGIIDPLGGGRRKFIESTHASCQCLPAGSSERGGLTTPSTSVTGVMSACL